MHNPNNAQQVKAKRIVRKALSLGLAVSVSDGDGDWAADRSSDFDAIIAAIGEMDIDELIFYDEAAGKRAGWMMLVWEFDGTADELPAAYTDNPAMEALAAA